MYIPKNIVYVDPETVKKNPPDSFLELFLDFYFASQVLST